MSGMEKKKTWHQKHVENRTFSSKFADGMTAFFGSWTFIWIHVIWFALWIVLPVEAFPYGLLTMVVSLEAILLSKLIMMSQNRQSDRDRLQADADYEPNIEAKKEIEELQVRLARIEDEKLEKILKILETR